jgi:allantoin racemase
MTSSGNDRRGDRLVALSSLPFLKTWKGEDVMKFIVIPPYRAGQYTPTGGHYMVVELIANMRERGQLEGIEVDVDDGFPIEDPTGARNEEVLAIISAGFLKRARMYCEGDKYDAILTSGGIEPGFPAARMISKIPVAGSVHSAIHVASLIGDRFAVIHKNDPTALIVRRLVKSYGFDHKLTSVRYIGHSSPSMQAIFRAHKKGEREKTPEGKKFIDDITAQCLVAIEEDRVDSLIFGDPPFQCLHDEIRARLDAAGYAEIPIICALPAAVEMAKTMVNMKLMQAPRAYPSDSLKAKPKFR